MLAKIYVDIWCHEATIFKGCQMDICSTFPDTDNSRYQKIINDIGKSHYRYR